MSTANERLVDVMLAHQVGLQRYSGTVRNRVLAILNRTERELARTIREGTERLARPDGFRPTRRNLRRLQNLRDSVALLRGAAFGDMSEEWVAQMNALVQREPEFVTEAWRTVSVVTLDTALPATADLAALVSTSPFEGRTLRTWARSVRDADLRRIGDQVVVGLTQGTTPAQIARSVVGTPLQRGSDGVTQVTRNQAASLTRTMVNHFSNAAKELTYLENEDVLTVEVYLATLDSRTTPVCRALDGNRYPLGVGPRPPVHWNCRSVRVALLDDEFAGTRPMKPVTERQLLREYSRANGISPAPTRRAGLPRGHKGNFDEFSRGRVRQLTGTVPAETTYQQFLERQSAELQDDILGPTRGRLFRRGGLTLDRFVSRDGDELTLAQLARREAEAFRRAGLQPEEFV